LRSVNCAWERSCWKLSTWKFVEMPSWWPLLLGLELPLREVEALLRARGPPADW
jgi:hypothetical protein